MMRHRSSTGLSSRNKLPAVFVCLFVLIIGNAFGQHIQAQADDVQPDVYEQITALITKLKVKQAIEKIENLLDQNEHDHQALMLRKALANVLARVSRNEEAEQQFEKILKYLLSGSEESRALLKHLPQIMINLKYLRQNIEPKASQTLDRAIEVLNSAIEDNPGNEAFSNCLSTAVNFKARGLHNQSRIAEMQQLYSGELDRLRRRWRMEIENVDHWLRLAYVLKAATAPKADSYQDFAAELEIERSNLLALGTLRFPDSPKLVQEYVALRLDLIRNLESQSPEGARTLLFELQSDLAKVRSNSSSPKSLATVKIQVDKYLQKLDRNLNRQGLVGSAAPVLSDIEWLRESSFEWKFPRKELTVLFFCSAHNDSSIAELIKVNDVVNNFSTETTLVAISHGLSQPFSKISTIRYKRGPDFEEQRQEYRRRIRQDIIEANNFEFPFGIVSDSADTANRFGIERVPFLVAIDASGVCREVFTGSIDPTDLKAILFEMDRSSR